MKPAPPYFGLILASCGKLESYLTEGSQLSDSGDEAKVAEVAHMLDTTLP